MATQPGTCPRAASPEAVARAFYEALVAGDADTVGALADRWFAPDAVLELPPSLPYGGRVESAHRLRRMFTAMAAGAIPAGPTGLRVVSVTGDEESAAVRLEFDWVATSGAEPVTSGALELWTFTEGSLTEIRAFYWDTAALLGVA
jgi:ketosteroid isomerase-like protein